MTRLTKILFPMLSLAGLAMIGTMAPQPGHASPSAQPVLVTNTSPMPVGGTVNIGNSPAVTATQSGTWNVGITGTPTANVQNTTGSALYITRPGFPYWYTLCAGGCGATSTTVPNSIAGLTVDFLEITNVTGECSVVQGTIIGTPTINAGDSVFVGANPVLQGLTNQGVNVYTIAQQLEAYIPAGIQLTAQMNAYPTGNATASGACIMHLAGWLYAH